MSLVGVALITHNAYSQNVSNRNGEEYLSQAGRPASCPRARGIVSILRPRFDQGVQQAV